MTANVRFICAKCGHEQRRYANARKCMRDRCGGDLVKSSSAAAKLIKKALEIEQQRQVLAKERDKFRDLVGEWNELLESWDEAIDGHLEVAKQELDAACDKLSEFI